MNVITAKVTRISPFVTPDGQVKPLVELLLFNGITRKISYNNYKQLIAHSIIPDTEISFIDTLRPKNISTIKHPSGYYNNGISTKIYIPTQCPACGSKLSLYKRNYWCTNIDCIGTRKYRLRRILRHSPAKMIYNVNKLVKWAMQQPHINNTDFINPLKLINYIKFINNKFDNEDLDSVKSTFLIQLSKWNTANKLYCLEARIGYTTAMKLSQNDEVGISIITKYTVRDMMAVGIPRLEADKLRHMFDSSYNQMLINQILKVEGMITNDEF